MSAAGNKKNSEFVNNIYTPKVASTIVEELIDKQMNLEKLNYMKKWEQNHQLGMDVLNNELNNLRKKKKNLLNTIAAAKSKGKKVRLNGSIQIDITD